MEGLKERDEFIVDMKFVTHKGGLGLFFLQPGPHAFDGIEGLFVMGKG